MNKKEEETIQYYEKELGWVPSFVKILAKYPSFVFKLKALGLTFHNADES